jgi:hypothetical protein
VLNLANNRNLSSDAKNVHRDLEVGLPVSHVSNDSCVSMYSNTGDALEATLPVDDADIRQCLFRLARRLKATKKTLQLGEREFTEILERWCKLAVRNGVDVSLDEIESEMATIWPKVRFAAGEDVVGTCWAAISTTRHRPPACANAYRHPKVKQLISLCCELQKANGAERTFFLTCEDASRFLGTSVEQAGRWLRMLRRVGPKQVLRLVEAHKFGEKLPNRYKFIGAAV